MKKDFMETSKTGAIVWLLQRISAVFLFILLILHFITYHFISKGVIQYDVIFEKMKSPWFNLLQFIFLITALYHGFNGIWAVVEDYLHSKFLRITLFSLLITIFLCLLFIGMLTIFKVGNLS
jgi:succinate dehydrogenase / fumarate reductase membrane anchor subunit